MPKAKRKGAPTTGRSMTTTEADKLAYGACMERIKRRLRLIRALTSQSVSTGDEAADAEFACLQMRKILEQVAFSALAANRARYSAVYEQFEREWRAKRILDRLRKLHPDFYPVPVAPVPKGPDQWHFERLVDGFLTEADFVFLYDRCSDTIHDWNPFRPDPPVVQLERPLSEWADRIERLLLFHWIRLLDQTDFLLIQLSDESGRAHVFTAAPVAG